MRKQTLQFLFLLFCVDACLTHAAEAPGTSTTRTNAVATSLRVFADMGPVGKIDRGILQFGKDQFTFVVPQGFRGTFDNSTRQVRLASSELQATITIAVQSVPEKADAGISADSLRAAALSNYKGAQVVDQFEASVGDWRGPAIEIEYSSTAASKTSVRLVQIPFPGGVIAFTVLASADRIRTSDHALNQLLLSIRSGINGAPAAFQRFLPDL